LADYRASSSGIFCGVRPLLEEVMLKSIIAGLVVVFLFLLLSYDHTEGAEEIIKNEPVLTHQQEVYLYALEWCESRGVKTAVNPKDRDGTPSYYSFQFKPDTFKWLAIKYGVLEKTELDTLEKLNNQMADYDNQRLIVKYMILDKSTKWESQFPDCVKRKIGRPPAVI